MIYIKIQNIIISILINFKKLGKVGIRLSIEQRIRIVYLYVINKLEIVKNRFEVLRELSRKEDICVSKLTLFKTIKKWQTTYSFCNKRSVNIRLAHTKINNREMMLIKNEILKNNPCHRHFSLGELVLLNPSDH